MRVARSRQVDALSDQRSATFSGVVWADPVLSAADGVVVADVFFAPGGRTHWHTHEIAQILIVLAGEGWLQVEGGDGALLSAGDTAHISAGELHWHGALPGSYLLHRAVSVGTTEWLTAVSDDDYQAAIGAR